MKCFHSESSLSTSMHIMKTPQWVSDTIYALSHSPFTVAPWSRYYIIPTILYKREDWKSERDSHLSKLTQLVGGSGQTWLGRFTLTQVLYVHFLHFLFFFLNIFIYLFLAALGLHCCTRAPSSCFERGPLLVVVHMHLIVVASLVVEHRL